MGIMIYTFISYSASMWFMIRLAILGCDLEQ